MYVSMHIHIYTYIGVPFTLSTMSINSIEEVTHTYEEEDTCMSYEEEDTCMSHEEEDTCMSHEEEDTY